MPAQEWAIRVPGASHCKWHWFLSVGSPTRASKTAGKRKIPGVCCIFAPAIFSYVSCDPFCTSSSYALKDVPVCPQAWHTNSKPIMAAEFTGDLKSWALNWHWMGSTHYQICVGIQSAGEVSYELQDLAFCFTVLKVPDDICTLTSLITSHLTKVESCKVCSHTACSCSIDTHKLNHCWHFCSHFCPRYSFMQMICYLSSCIWGPLFLFW